MRKLMFFKKELMEIIKTPKIIIMPSIMLFFGLISPISARYTPDLIKIMSKSMGEGIRIEIPPATFQDSYIQFFKNLTQIGILVVILTFMNTVVEEKLKGSAVLVLTKSVSRMQFIISKYAAGCLLFSFAYLISAGACMYYTWLLFESVYVDGLLAAFLSFWIYGIMILAVTLLASTMAQSHTMAAVLSIIGFALISVLTFIPKAGGKIPGALPSISMDLVLGKAEIIDIVTPSILAAVTVILLVSASVLIFKRQEL